MMWLKSCICLLLAISYCKAFQFQSSPRFLPLQQSCLTFHDCHLQQLKNSLQPHGNKMTVVVVRATANSNEEAEEDEMMQSSRIAFDDDRSPKPSIVVPKPSEEDNELPGIPKDAKETRVLIYIILSLIPCLFLLPFVLSRDFVPVDPSEFAP
mmetsp:Transcript_12951/g.16920  ORF Transcript_12951/g.16920 Transcript_12951/m.16920 type:complete len:153 (+) Transcript_12951:33-491(+)